MFKKGAFTLAEVLITLGIIGVVAAMTIPTVIAKCKYNIMRNRFKKHLSELNQAVLIAYQEEDINFASEISRSQPQNTYNACPKDILSSNTFCGIFNGTMKNITFIYALNKSFQSESLQSSCPYYIHYRFSDGTRFGFNAAPSEVRDCTLKLGEQLNSEWFKSHYGCFGYIDTDGQKKNFRKNTEVYCTDGTKTVIGNNPSCTVSFKNKGNIIPIVFHDSTVEPATNAGHYLLAK